jgi:predicted small lipoprotein YifL
MVRRMSIRRTMGRSRTRRLLRLAVIGAFALALAGCGRKGPLDPPPSAAAPNPPSQSGLMSPVGGVPIGQPPDRGNGGFTSEGHPQAPQGEKKAFPLDVLLN